MYILFIQRTDRLLLYAPGACGSDVQRIRRQTAHDSFSSVGDDRDVETWTDYNSKTRGVDVYGDATAISRANGYQ